MRDVKDEHTLTGLRLLQSYFNQDQLQTPALQFFKENHVNLSIRKSSENGEIEVDWNDKGDDLSMSQAPNAGNLHALLRRLSVTFSECSAVPSLGAFDNADYGRTSILGGNSLLTKDFVLEGPSDSYMLADGLQTPGVSSQRMSVGMTPKTLRLPKPGEMLLSVHGSPLGVFKEDNMEAILESEEG
ncbi:uncharacterized protein LOC126654641 isoform X2 [Mercurialis annua]|nr:uncharacterized protein LOC126654641 isoform X2 [Mercurialis annua]XP_050204527.1 uncharacterized protein LOC126654641 isoform X2 [Mercurialis annua]